MKSALDFLTELAAKGVKLSLDGNDVNCYARKGALTKDITDGLIKFKPEIISILGGVTRPMPPVTGAVRRVEDPVEFPLSVGGKTHYLMQTLNPERSHAVPICLRLNRSTNLGALADAWQAVLRQHPILTARIVERKGAVHHVLDAQCGSTLRLQQRVDTDDHEFLRHLQSAIAAPFDLLHGPLTRIDLFTREQDCVLLIVVHHIVFDGFSVGLLLKALFTFYAELAAGRQVRISALPGYHEFVEWERRMLASEEGRSHAEYWRSQLAGELPSLKLLPNLPRGAAPADESPVVIEELPPGLAAWVRNFCRTHALQPSVVFLGVFQLLLHKYTGDEDIVVLMPTMVRPERRFSEAIGYFFNIVPIRTRFSAATLGQFLREVQATLLDALFHAGFPFSYMLDKQRKADGHGDFNVFFAYQNFKNLADGESVALQNEHGVARLEGFHQKPEGDFDLALEVYEEADSFRLYLQGDPGLYPRHVVKAFFEHFCVLLGEIGSDPGRPIREYPIATENEVRTIMGVWNQTEAEYPRERCIHEFFTDQAALSPENTAVVCGDLAWTYRELEDRTRTLAMHLQSKGVGPDDVVALFVERSLEMMLGIMGIVRAGAAYLPLDPDYPDDRLSYMLTDSHAALVMTQKRLVGKIRPLLGAGTELLVLDDEWPAMSERLMQADARQELRNEVTSANVSYVIYTSGSTGKPKGVQVEHRALVNRIHWMQKTYPLGAEDVVLQKTPYSFDVSVWEFFWPMMTGSTLVFAQPDGHRDVHYLEDLIARSRVTTLHFVPSMLHTFLNNARTTCDTVRRIFCSGEALDARSVERYPAVFPSAALHNLYGPTEAAIDVTAFDCAQLRGGFVPIGAPIDNTQIHILDRHQNVQPIGVPGELHIAGDGLARGYLNREQLTRERFVANPFDAGRRMYKTGDLACWLEDGNIQYLGRMDVQVKIGGARIEVGEIESQLNAHPLIKDSVVVAQGAEGYKQLIAFYVASPAAADEGAAVAQAELRAHLLKVLPDYMVPAGFVALESIPLTSSGKVDRRSLEQMNVALQSSKEYAAPRSDTEMRLADIWAEVFKEQGFVLGQTRIGVDDNFFELGGNSLLATQLIYKIRARFAVDLPIKALFDHTTIASFAGLVDRTARDPATGEEAEVDLAAEVILAPDILPAAAEEGMPTAEAGSVLLTGASGFLGAYLLHDLLTASDAVVTCLVRCRDVEDGARRLRENLAAYGLWRDEFAARLQPVPGDLAQPLLGLGEARFESLCRTVEAIYHNGALVNFAYPYRELKDSNVRGTEAVIRLASRGRRKPLHFVSTGSVFAPRSEGSTRVFETDALMDWRGVSGGYAQSKWVAEKLVALAAREGLPVRIYRPEMVAGDSVTGVCNTGDFFPRLIKGCVQLGAAPDADGMIGLVPVDYVSKAIVHLSRNEASQSTAFHIVNPRYIASRELGRLFESLGHPVNVIPYAEWRARLFADARTSSANALQSLLPLFTEKSPFEHGLQFDCTNTTEGLRGSSIVCPEIDQALLGTYLDYFKRVGHLA